jgi:hypothetical protein
LRRHHLLPHHVLRHHLKVTRPKGPGWAKGVFWPRS